MCMTTPPSLQELWDTFPGTSGQFLQFIGENEPELAARVKWCCDCHAIVDGDTCPYAPHAAPNDEEIRAILTPGLEAVANSLDRVRPVMDRWNVTVTFDSGLVVYTTASSLEDLHTCLVILRDRHPGDGDILRIEAS